MRSNERSLGATGAVISASDSALVSRANISLVKRGFLETVNRKKTIRSGSLSVRSGELFDRRARRSVSSLTLLTQLLAHALVEETQRGRCAGPRKRLHLDIPISGGSCAPLCAGQKKSLFPASRGGLAW